jgi:hypothetical protein
MKKLFPVALIAAAAIVVPAHASKPTDPGSQGKAHHTTKSHSPSKSHKCKPHKVGWVVKGTLVSQALTQNTDGTWSGTVNIDVTRTNHHANAEKGKTNAQYTLDHAKVTFVVTDQPPTGTVDQTDLRPGDRVKLIGKITALSKKCDQTGFTPSFTIRKVVFHDPAAPEPQQQPVAQS